MIAETRSYIFRCRSRFRRRRVSSLLFNGVVDFSLFYVIREFDRFLHRRRVREYTQVLLIRDGKSRRRFFIWGGGGGRRAFDRQI